MWCQHLQSLDRKPFHPPPLCSFISFSPSQYMVHVLLITSKSRSRPRASTFTAHMVWSSHLPSLEIPLLTPTLKHPGSSQVCAGTYCTRGLQTHPCQILTRADAACKHKHIRGETLVLCARTRLILPSFPWGLFDWQCPLQKGIMMEKGRGGGVEVPWRGEGFWGWSDREWEGGLGD